MLDIVTSLIVMGELKGRMTAPLPSQTLPLWFCCEVFVSLLEKFSHGYTVCPGLRVTPSL